MRNERLSAGGKKLYGYKQNQFLLSNCHPYGKWTCKSGREVLFNRFYEPILQREPGHPVTDADPKEWVEGIIKQEWFYKDGDGSVVAKTKLAIKSFNSFCKEGKA